MAEAERDAIAVRDLAKRYGRGEKRVDALRGVSLSVRRGEIYGLLGRNGAGKTTLVKVLLDMVRPVAGGAWILGVPSRSRAARRSVGYLPEDHRLPEYRTGEQALHFYAQLSAVPRRVRRQRVPQLLEAMGLADSARRKVRTYSKGMKQRLGLAQALVHDPQVLFLDEPTDGVDPVGRAQVRQVLERLRSEGKTIFLNSHLLGEVERVCDRVGILEAGRLVREGSIDELTRTRLSYHLKTSPPLDAAAREELSRVAVTVAAAGDGVEIGLAKEEDLDRVVDLLRARKVGIRGLTALRHSLEEVFLEALKETGPVKGDANRAPGEAGKT